MAEKHCKYCGGYEFKQTLTPDIKHYGREDCIACGKFCGWIKNPDTGGYKKEVEQLLRYTIENDPASNFLKSLKEQFSQRGFLSDKQFQSLKKIAEEI